MPAPIPDSFCAPDFPVAAAVEEVVEAVTDAGCRVAFTADDVVEIEFVAVEEQETEEGRFVTPEAEQKFWAKLTAVA
ncbi:hypothetical protein G7Y89_g15567 [Cudoniella acicularis]|uniref:Uncharacterized protein n=1 Tax=Cudoniella acicularis TaxID=354080 RepID=A0A8H4VJ39_9HELO|nr:hypothetical protein G7Y89_g15567 [Cudoniella acicularis]